MSGEMMSFFGFFREFITVLCLSVSYLSEALQAVYDTL